MAVGVSPDHDIMRDAPDDEVCALCEGTGEIECETPAGDRVQEACPQCMQQAHEADMARAQATITALRARLTEESQRADRFHGLLMDALEKAENAERGRALAFASLDTEQETLRRVDEAEAARDAALALVERYGKALREIAVLRPPGSLIYHATDIATAALSVPAAGTSEGGMGGMGKGVGT